jgi:hypothetical protein
VPLSAVPAAAVENLDCGSGGVCGFVWNDLDNDGIQDADEPGIAGAVVTIGGVVIATDENGFYALFVEPGTYEVAVQIPPGTQVAPANNPDTTDDLDSDGISDEMGNSVATLTYDGTMVSNVDFGFYMATAAPPGTGTPGYWKNHPDAWPVEMITAGGVDYTKAQALNYLGAGGKDKTLTMFSSLVPAKLNLLIGNDGSCVATTIAKADEWMATYGPVGSGVHAASYAWKVGEPLHRLMDNYNNGMLCAPHRD